MRDIVYIADFFYPAVKGGAEMYGNVLLDLFDEQGIEYETVKSRNLGRGHLSSYSDRLFIIGNFVALNPDIQQDIVDCIDYLIIEHDYKLDAKRQPQRFDDYEIPDRHLRNEKFYQNAIATIVQSTLQQKIFTKNLQNVEYYNFSGSLWGDEKLNTIEKIRNSAKKPSKEAVYLDDDNPIKGKELAEKYCHKNDIDADAIGGLNQEEFWKELSKAEKLIYFPLTPETLGRVAVEARMLGMNVVSNDKLGAKQEGWFSDSSQKITNRMRDKATEILEVIEKYGHAF